MDLHAATLQTLQTYLDKAAQVWGKTFPMPEVRYDLRGKTTGQAHYVDYYIRLNLPLFQENTDYFLNQTIPHELAHLLSFRLYGRMGLGHGQWWKVTMKRLGLKPTRCHNLVTTPARNVKKFRYVCSCHKFDVGSVRHRKMQQGVIYRCRKCKKQLVFLNPVQ